MAVALQILASGFAAGAVYGLVGVGQAVLYRLTGVVHFALGELIALGVFVTLYVAAGSGPVSETTVGGLRFLLALAVGLVATTAAGAGAYLLAIASPKPHAEAFRNLGYLAMKSGDRASAAGYFRQYLESSPEAGDREMIEFYLEDMP